jgi:predicted transcriptional regulator
MATRHPASETTVHAVARHITLALEEAGISRLDAAKRTGIPRETFYRKVAGIGKPFDVDELDKIAGLLGTSVPELVADAMASAA